MRKGTSTILGLVLTLAVAGGAGVWNFRASTADDARHAEMLAKSCNLLRSTEVGAPLSQEFAECDHWYRAPERWRREQIHVALIFGTFVGAGFALLYFGGRRWLRRRRQPSPPPA